MSLNSSIRLAANTLRSNQIGLQVVGQNIANADTPGYIREEAIFVPNPPQQIGSLLIGTGVNVLAVVQKIDNFLEERLRGSISERLDAEVQESIYLELEAVIGELNDADLSSLLDDFFNSIAEILNQPESIAVRNLAVLEGSEVTSEIHRLASRIDEIRSDLNGQVSAMASDINRLLSQIRELNVQITIAEGGDVSPSDAVGLRDQRLQALEELSGLIDIKVKEQADGSTAVFCGGDYLVFQGFAREVEVFVENSHGLSATFIGLTTSDASLDLASGQLAGLLAARDDILGGFLDDLDQFTQTLAFEFNKLYSRGQGLSGYRELTSEFRVADEYVALDQAGLEFTPENGSFQVIVYNSQTGVTKTTDVLVDLNGLGRDTTLARLATMLNEIESISAEVTSRGNLTISADSSEYEFAFSGDTSGVLAALGLNTFFSGSGARDLAVNEILRQDPAKFAVSAGGIGVDTDNAVELAGFLDYPIQSENGFSMAALYDRLISDVTQASAATQAVAEGARVFEGTLRGQALAISGVNLDEEAIHMISLQTSYQAAARYINTLTELLELVSRL